MLCFAAKTLRFSAKSLKLCETVLELNLYAVKIENS